MKNKFKKSICASLVLLMFLPSVTVFGTEVGDKIGEVLSTDIVTYVEGVPVPSFNIAGRTAIIVENLNAKNLPFKVWYDDDTRTLSIEDGEKASRNYFHFEDTQSSEPVGTPIMDVVYTDIKTYYAGKKLESFNIGGFTCVYATDFANLYGKYTWNQTTRRVDIFRQKSEILGSIYSKETTKNLQGGDSIIERTDTFDRWGTPLKSTLSKDSEGNYCSIEIAGNIYIDKYDSKFNYISSSKIKAELPIFGGFFEGDDCYYMLSGQENLKGNDKLPVIRLSIYDKDFKKVKDVTLSDSNTAVPFDASNVSLSENDDYLVIHTARSLYETDGSMPQTQLTIIFDKESWEVINSLDKFQPNHTSHALKEFVKIDGDKIVTANYSDANPIRGTFVQELDFEGNLLSSKNVFKIPGPPGANCTGAMLGGFEISEDNYIFAMSSIDHSLAEDYADTYIKGVSREERDIYVIAASKDGTKLETECLTYYSGENKTASVPYLVNLEDETFMVLWQKFSNLSNKSDTLCYAVVDKNGKVVVEPRQADGYLSESCQPVFLDGKVTWYVNTPEGRIFYRIDPSPSSNTYPDAI